MERKRRLSNRKRRIYATLYGTGLCFAEVFSLRHEDVDVQAGYVHVRWRGGTDDMPPFKVTDRERRRVPLPRYALRLLDGGLKHRSDQSPYLLLDTDRYERVRERWHRLRARGDGWQNRFLTNNTLRNVQRHVKWAGIVTGAKFTVHGFRKS